jgi:hypothetical protein
MLWPENPRLILYIKKIYNMLLKVLYCFNIFAEKKGISLTDLKKDQQDKEGVLMLAVS